MAEMEKKNIRKMRSECWLKGHLKSSEQRRITKPLNSYWRSPIRAAGRTSGDVGLADNSMGLDSLVMKDVHRLLDVRE
jgi:hypothetical protein